MEYFLMKSDASINYCHLRVFKQTVTNQLEEYDDNNKQFCLNALKYAVLYKCKCLSTRSNRINAGALTCINFISH